MKWKASTLLVVLVGVLAVVGQDLVTGPLLTFVPPNPPTLGPRGSKVTGASRSSRADDCFILASTDLAGSLDTRPGIDCILPTLQAHS